MTDYELLDSGHGQKLERFGPYTLVRPCAQALWKPTLGNEAWENIDARFERLPEGKWHLVKNLPGKWQMILKNLNFHIEPTPFGHLGIFPEHSELWDWIESKLKQSKETPSCLNLFGYSGATTLFMASCGASVCHLDASKKMVDRARENAALNQMQDHPIRWIVDDVFKFLKREHKRGRKYDGVVLDPPSFGRGSKGEVFKIEKDFMDLMHAVKDVLSDKASFVLVTCHTEGISPITLKNLIEQVLVSAQVEVGELLIPSSSHSLPKGIYAKCSFR